MDSTHRGPDAGRYTQAPSDEESIAYGSDLANTIHIASVEEKKRLWWRNAVVNTFLISCWFLFALILSVYNKWMFAPERYAFPYPLFVTTVQMFIQFALAAAIRAIWPKRFRPDRQPTVKDYGKKVLPTAVATCLDIGLSNLSLKTITLSFYTMCKSSSLIFVLLFAFLFRLEKFSWRLVGVIFLIFSGVLLMVATETHFILEGLVLVLSASALGGFRWSLTQILLKDKKIGLDNPAATIFWIAPSMGITLGALSLIIEGWVRVFATKFFANIATCLETAFFLFAPGVLAFCMVMSEFYIIQRTGVVPMSIAGIAKEVATITMSAWFFGDQLTPLNITGVAITVCGIILFTFHKYRKSIESTVPLDAHGNPVSADDLDDPLGSSQRHIIELEETMRLTAEVGDDSDEDDETRGARLLFNANGSDDDDAEELRSIHSSKIRWDSADHGSTGRGDGGVLGESATPQIAKDSPGVWVVDS